MKRVCLILVTLSLACATTTALQRAQQSHDALALAQDTEAALCWGVTNVAAAIAANVAPNHCTAPLATTIGLTDARHQQFNVLMKKALDDHAAITRVLASGANAADTSVVHADIAQILVIVAQLAQGNLTVQQLGTYLQQARTK